ncbi:MAG: amidase [Pirellulales bacterium]
MKTSLVAGAAASSYAAGNTPTQAAETSRGEVPSFEFDEVTIAELQQRMKSGQLSAREITEKYLARIAAIDKGGPTLNSVIEINPDALEIAAALDKERQQQGPRGPLHGIPILIKDNIDTADRMATTAGSLALAGSKPPSDATVAERLRRAGAVLLGKTNLSEWANLRSGRSTSGWSGRGGLTRQAYALDRNPSGSSSGSGVAVSANLCAAAIGTETDGSIVSPSSVNGIVGIKPTVGLVSRTGIVPLSHTQDSAGPMARTVADAAAVLGALVGIDADDPATQFSQGKSHTDYTQFLASDGLRGARIGVVRRKFGFHPAVDAVMEDALRELERQGAILVDPADIETLSDLKRPELTVLLYELKADMKAYLARLGPDAPVKSLADIIAFNEQHRDREMPYFGQELFLAAEATGGLDDPEYVEALALCGRLAREEGIDAVMDRHRLDCLVAPTTGPAGMTDLIYGDRGTGGSSTAAAVAGYPSVTLPVGFVSGLPIGISFFGRAFSEPVLIKLASSFEHATKHRRPPRFLPTANG